MDGIVYLCMGVKHQAYLVANIAMLRRRYNGPVLVVTDSDRKISYSRDIEYVRVEPWSGGVAEISDFSSRFHKTKMYSYSPFDVSIFLDTDAMPIGDIRPLFDVSEDQIGMVEDVPLSSSCSFRLDNHRADTALRDDCITALDVAVNDIQYNTGMIVWSRGNKVARLFEEWHRQWLRFQRYDQTAMVRAIHATKSNVAYIDPKYNDRTRPQSIMAARSRGSVVAHFVSLEKEKIENQIRGNIAMS